VAVNKEVMTIGARDEWVEEDDMKKGWSETKRK